ncbi:MAG TPA: 5-formyltetrahydrofolate cyclo-ligase [Steroidobacteraceae bacterium]|nr:5-formyltetrahydrofolate cyclo-ligase [Steroidobacteraceae bacterium]
MDERAEIMAWRRAERLRLIESRLRVPVAERQEASQRIAAQLDRYCREADLLRPGKVVSGYWPLRGEPDLRPWLGTLHESGHVVVLPVVVRKGAPLAFRRWFPGCAMEKGFWNIPVPVDPAEFTPQLLLAPVVGFDARGYRLGYGGGYFDRTLELLRALQVSFHAIGIGYAATQLPSIHPLPHDIALDVVITEAKNIT